MIPKWDFVLTDNRGNVISELTNLKERKLKLILNRIPVGTFVVDCSHPFANYFRLGDIMFIKAYRTPFPGATKELMAYGPITSTQKVRSSAGGAQTSTMSVTWSGISWRLEKRLIPASKTPKGVEYGKLLAFEETGLIPKKIIEELNKEPLYTSGLGVDLPTTPNLKYGESLPAYGAGIVAPQSDTGIRIGSIGKTPSSYVGPWYFQNALGAIALVASTFSGFDWEVEPVEPFRDSIGIVFGLLNVAEGFGTNRPDVVWEYGDGKNNVREFTEFRDSSGNLNRGYSTPTSFPENSQENVSAHLDQAAIEARNFIYDDSVPSDIIAQPLRVELLRENINVRKEPKTVITFKPTNDPTFGVTPIFKQDFGIGDTFLFRAVEYNEGTKKKEQTFNGLVRMYAAEFELDEGGAEAFTPVLISEGAG